MEKKSLGYPVFQSLSEFLKLPYEVKSGCCSRQVTANCCVTEKNIAEKEKTECCPQPSNGSPCC